MVWRICAAFEKHSIALPLCGVRAEAYRQFANRPEHDHHPVTLDFLGEHGHTLRLRSDVDAMNDDGSGMSEELAAELVFVHNYLTAHPQTYLPTYLPTHTYLHTCMHTCMRT